MSLIHHLALGLLLFPLGFELPSVSFHNGLRVLEITEDDDFEQLLIVFKRTNVSGSLAERGEALLALSASGEALALLPIVDEFRTVWTDQKRVEKEHQKLRIEIRHAQRLVGDLEQQSRSESKNLDETLKEQERKLKEMENKLEWNVKEQLRIDPWLELLRIEMTKFALTIDSSTHKRLEKQVWKDIELASDVDDSLSNIVALGHIGTAGTAVQLQKSIVKYVKERVKLEKTLNKEMRNVLKMEEQLQDEAIRSGGRTSGAFGAQYEQSKKEAFATQTRIAELVRMGTACAAAGAVALSRESTEERAKSVKNLLRAESKGDNGARRLTISLLGDSGLADVGDLMLEELKEQADPLVCANLIDALARPNLAHNREAFEDFLLETGLTHQSWLVKARSASTLAKLRTKSAITTLIPLLAAEKGRVRDDFEAALNSLTGMTFRGKTILWHRWWTEHEATFRVPSEADALGKLNEEQNKRREGSGFFGIESASQRILFVVDLSGSMNFAMVPRDNPNDDLSGGRRPDLPQKGENSRLEEAKIALKSTLGDQELGGVFNLVFYASSVWPWQGKLADVTESSIAAAQKSVDGLKATGATNIYGALKFALDMARVTSTDKWYEPKIDTIFFLSDGRASVGLITDSDKILAYVRERNSSAGISINVVGLSGAQDAYLLQRLALENGGRYVSR